MIDYSDKLKDPRWQKKRLVIFNRDNWQCLLCSNSENTLTVHHRIYIPNTEPWDYPDELLMTVCEFCHYDLKRDNILNKDKRCKNCYHYQEFKHCSCRDKIDVIKHNCPDWLSFIPYAN